ncbi:gluconokinase [Nocardioides aequoreus]|uniref:gluconokinase n=1 Tax=Nocardioides aequoreus TaxID=397278 RepID=UPI000AC2BD08|nr:gluconokinase [Nocardioides aequoreus]
MTAPLVVVVMGTTSTGKSSVGERLAESLGAGFVEGDDLHPQANVDKMASGTPLTDDDRWPWLELVAERIREAVSQRHRLVVTCSALKRAYRDVLRGDEATAAEVFFCHLAGSKAVLEERIAGRRGHFMPTSLLDSQLDTLEELGPDEQGARVDVAPPLDEVVRTALAEVSAPR